MSKQPHIYYRQVEREALPTLVDSFADQLTYLFFESAPTMDLQPYATPDPSWLRGRAFGPEMEVRWQRTDEEYDVHLLTEVAQELDGWEEIHLGGEAEMEASDDFSILLWGTHRQYLPSTHIQAGEGDEVPHEWIETRIPRPLHYPVVEVAPFVEAVAINYVVRGKVVLTRLKGLRPTQGEREGNDE